MAIENEGSTERINGTYRYILRLYDRLINGQKALITLMNIQVFFDILVPNGETSDKCKEKSYLRIYMNGTGKRKKAIQAIQEKNFETTSDDLYSFHQKQGKETSPLCPHEIYVSIKDFCLLEDLTIISDQFPISAFLWDRVKSENDFVKKYLVKAPEKGEEDLEEKEYIGNPIKIKIIEKEGSLKFFLQKFSLDSKADMPYDKLYTALSRAFGKPKIKIRNLLNACAIKRDMVISTKVPEDIEKGKYPDAYVFPPKKGIMTERPII
ncbi:9604_t:CDS:2, partial [Funneliformis geosporum]